MIPRGGPERCQVRCGMIGRNLGASLVAEYTSATRRTVLRQLRNEEALGAASQGKPEGLEFAALACFIDPSQTIARFASLRMGRTGNPAC
jgi:hypothetical protein